MPESQVERIMRSFRAQMLAGDRAQQERMARAWLRVEAELLPIMELLARDVAELQASGAVVNVATLMTLERYQRLMSQMQVEVWRFADAADSEITDLQRQFGRYGLESVTQMLSSQFDAAGVSADFATLPIEAVENMVGLAGDGSPLRTLLRNVYPVTADGVTQALIRNTANGVNPRRTAREMARSGEAGLQRSLLIARTEQLRVYRQAALDSMKASGVVSGYKRMAARDRRVCLGCLVLDGKRYGLNESFDEHPQGRCTLVPVVMGMPEIAWESGEDWIARQDDATQRTIMGGTRFDMWKAGNASLADMVRVTPNDTWGGSVGLVPVAELERR